MLALIFSTDTASLSVLFASSFLAATLLPGGSEAVLFGVLKAHPTLFWAALAVVTMGNTLGGMTSYLVGRLLPQTELERGMALIKRYGAAALLLAWVPLIGDALCVGAGWLRLNPWLAACFMAIGKFSRYWVIAYLTV